MSESHIVADARLKLSIGDSRLFRNNCGALKDRNGTWVRYGLCTGSSDLIGFRSIVVTPEMVGKRLAVFVALEGKTATGKLAPEQVAFISLVKGMGGLAGTFRSTDEARAILAGEL